MNKYHPAISTFSLYTFLLVFIPNQPEDARCQRPCSVLSLFDGDHYIGKGSGQPSSDQSDNRTVYRPKYVTIEYPFETPDGIKTMGVDVPLLTIVPITVPRISEVRFKTLLEVGVKEDNSLEIAVPSMKKGGLFNADDPPEGLKNSLKALYFPSALHPAIHRQPTNERMAR
ncbi:hypothetical protein L4D15_15980 [Enterovibrio norvegicus]|uniref:hypothetical protein n=1 Tax=Enterovibrio norvegicus TaxID=188144 RepID=UPI003D0DC52D